MKLFSKQNLLFLKFFTDKLHSNVLKFILLKNNTFV